MAAAARLDLDQLSEEWQHAFDAARGALDASHGAFPPTELGARRRELGAEVRSTELLLDEVARADRVIPLPWLSGVRIRPSMLGLDGETCACVFDLDGVLTDSGVAHAAAWAAVFDPLLLRQAEQMGHDYRPFDADSDYRSFLDGRPRLEGIHAFLASRGIHLADGRWSDPPESETAFGLARRKGEALERVLRRRGITALPGARRYLEAAGHAGLPRAVVSCSQRTDEMLALAGLTSLVEVTIDATAIEIGGLRSRPAPDVLDAACGALGVRADRAVTFTHTPEGVAAGVAAGMVVVGVGDDATRRQLGGFGAERVAPSLVSLLDRRIALR